MWSVHVRLWSEVGNTGGAEFLLYALLCKRGLTLDLVNRTCEGAEKRGGIIWIMVSCLPY